MASPDSTTIARTCAVILAGGRGSRMGGEDKCLICIGGKPLVGHLIDALRPQVDDILISANRNLDSYARFGFPVIEDRLGGFQGPLAGMAAALERCDAERLLTVPGDAPLLAADYAARMQAALADSGAAACVAEFEGRRQPVYCLLSSGLRDSLDTWLQQGGRATHSWLDAIGAVGVDFSDQPRQFINLNSADDRARLEAILTA